MPTIAIDVTPAVFDALTKSSQWLTDDEVWKGICATGFPAGHVASSYPGQIRDAVAKKKSEGFKFVLMYAVREERMQLLQLY
jgi:translation initiation factor 2-alpha kinase 4